MEIQTDDLSGAALDWAVAKCLGNEIQIPETGDFAIPEYSTSMALGGPIIERECDELMKWMEEPGWDAFVRDDNPSTQKAAGMSIGPTVLIAGLRCYVKSVSGKTITIPDCLLDILHA